MKDRCKGVGRSCIGCRQVKNRDELVRYVLDPTGHVAVDYAGRLPGRGAYTCIDSDCLVRALEKRQFRRAFRRDHEPADVEILVQSLKEQICRRIDNLLGIGRKSGVAVVGSNMVLDGLRREGTFSLIFVASDIGAAVGGKVLDSAQKAGVKVYRTYDKITLSQLLGRGEVSVAGFSSGQLADALESELERIWNFEQRGNNG